MVTEITKTRVVLSVMSMFGGHKNCLLGVCRQILCLSMGFPFFCFKTCFDNKSLAFYKVRGSICPVGDVDCKVYSWNYRDCLFLGGFPASR